jgi:CheY-like chemotaxis protein
MDAAPLTVLLVQGDADMRYYLRGCLRHHAPPIARIVEAGDGLEALRAVRTEAVDLVISDVAIPALDGHRLARAIRDDPALRHVAVLLIGGEGAVRDSNGASPADGVLTTPFNASQLIAAMAAVAARPARHPNRP